MITRNVAPTEALSTGTDFVLEDVWDHAGPQWSESVTAYSNSLGPIVQIPGFVLRRPIPFSMEIISGEVVLTDLVFRRYGVGDNLLAARVDLAESLADYFRTLREEESRLSCGAKKHFDAMQHLIH
jgi:hypothetical protein